MTEDNLALDINVDVNLAPRGATAERIIEVVVQAPPMDAGKSKVPLNLALVLDHSGSMSGEKLEYAKKAAAHVLDLLQETDWVALVAFDSHVRLLASSTQLTGDRKSLLKSHIQELGTGSSTNLSGGWLKGCQQVAEAPEGGLNRTLL